MLAMERFMSYLSLFSLIGSHLARAAPALLELRAISSDLLATLNLYEQYAAAPYCPNNVNSVGDKLTCSAGNCPLVQADNTLTLSEFQNSLFTDVTGFVAVDNTRNLVLVSFRGSVSVRNWLTNFNIPQVPTDICTGCLVHQGWWSAWREARQEVLAAITGTCDKYPGYQLKVTGHSAGGAIATLAAAELRKKGYIAALYTFGAPRLGGPTVSQFITNQPGGNYRVTHDDDPVPNVPPIWLGYNHISPEYWIKTGNNVPVTANDIQVCDGLANIQCNGGQVSLDVEAHLWYFNDISACNPGGFEFKA